MYRDYDSDPFTRDYLIFHLNKESLKRRLYVYRTIFGCIANGSKSKQEFDKNIIVALKKAKQDGYALLTNEIIVEQLEEKLVF
jgi:hypothetical protein